MDLFKLTDDKELTNITSQECIECLDYIISNPILNCNDDGYTILSNIYNLLRHFSKVYDIQKKGLFSLRSLFLHYPSSVQYIGYQANQVPIHDFVINSIRVTDVRNYEYFGALCDLIYHIAADNGVMQLAFMNKNVHRLLNKRLHEALPALRINIIRSLRALCLFSFEHKEQLIKLDFHKKACKILKESAPPTDLIINCVALVASLCDNVFHFKCVQSLNLLIDSDTSVPQNVIAVLKLGFKSNWLPLISESLALLSLLCQVKRNVLRGEEQEFINLLVCHYENLPDENNLKETMEISIWYLIQDSVTLKSLLNSSVEQKNYTLAHCLILLEKDKKLALQYALRMRDFPLCKTLLQHGTNHSSKEIVADFLKEGDNDLISLVLKNFGYFPKDQALRWCNFQLDNLQPEWIIKALSKDIYEPSLSGKPNTIKLKVSEKIEKEQHVQRPKSSKLKFKLPVFRHGSVASREGIEFRRQSLANSFPPLTSKRNLNRQYSDKIYRNMAQRMIFVFDKEEYEFWRSSSISSCQVAFNAQYDIRFRYKNDSDKYVMSIEEANVIWKRRSFGFSQERDYNLSNISQLESLEESLMIDSQDNENNRPFRYKSNEDLDTSYEELAKSDCSLELCENVRKHNSYREERKNLNIKKIIEEKKSKSFMALVPSLKPYISNISYINASGNKIGKIPVEMFRNLPLLKELDLSNNEIEELPNSWTCHRSLESINLSNNRIESINYSQVCMSLTELLVASNKIKLWPQQIAKIFPMLKILDLSMNHIQLLPNKCIDLRLLTNLSISNNHLKIIPEYFLRHFLSIETLKLCNNLIEYLPSSETAHKLLKLTHLKLANNKINCSKTNLTSFAFILALPNLRTLDVSSNEIYYLPRPSLWISRSLTELLLSHNSIEKIDINHNEAKDWRKIERIDLSFNNLKCISKEIGHLTNLASLNLSNNPSIKSMPDELGRLCHLWEFPTTNLNLDLPDTIINGRTRDLIKFLNQKLRKSKCLNQVRLIIVGDEKSGKTSIANRLMCSSGNSKQNVKNPFNICGMFVSEWKPFSRKYIISIWDMFGGEDVYSINMKFFSKRAVYIIAINLLEEEGCWKKSLKKWSCNIYSKSPYCQIIVAATHLDRILPKIRTKTVSNLFKIVRKEISNANFGVVKEIVVLDASRNNPGTNLLKQSVLNTFDRYEVSGQKVIEEKVPAAYIKLWSLLIGSCGKKNIITHNELREMVKSSSLDLFESEIRQAGRFLHDTGCILYFSKDMPNLYFPCPLILCNILSDFLTSNPISTVSTTAIIDSKSVHDAAKQINLPEEMRGQSINALLKFELIIPVWEDQYLLPIKLDKHFNRYQDFLIEYGKDENVIGAKYICTFIPFGFWPKLLSFLLSQVDKTVPKEDFYSIKIDNDNLIISVKQSVNAYRTLANIIGKIETLFNEWYPNLLTRDGFGVQHVTRVALCTKCQHSFDVESIEEISCHKDNIWCPDHRDFILLEDLVPDFYLKFLEKHLLFDKNDTNFNEKSSKSLGYGAFSRVFKSLLKKRHVAAKVYSKKARGQVMYELLILSTIRHSSIIELYGILPKPPIIFLQLAPKGSLTDILKENLSTCLKLQICLEIIEGVEKLHNSNIIYRDLKPDNILVFSLDKTDGIHIKLTDFGIARWVPPFGLKSNEGTPGYRAPEIINTVIYSFMADVFSYGITIYQLFYNGKHPFGDAHFPAQLEDSIVELSDSSPLIRYDSHWIGIQSLIGSCLASQPEKRSPVPISENVAVECCCVTPEGFLFMACCSEETVYVQKVDTINRQSQGIHIPDKRFICVCHFDERVIFGSQSGLLWIFTVKSLQKNHYINSTGDAIVCLLTVAQQSSPKLLVGFADGSVSSYNLRDVLSDSTTIPLQVIRTGRNCIHALSPMDRRGSKIAIACGSEIKILYNQQGFYNIFDHVNSSNSNRIIGLECCRNTIIVCRRNSVTLEKWSGRSKERRKLIDAYDCSHIVSSIHLTKVTLWIGNKNGQINLLNAVDFKPLLCVQAHYDSVKVLCSGYGYVISCGYGWEDEGEGKLSDCSYVLVWDQDFGQIYEQFRKYQILRKESSIQS
ncbi:DgyrCDS10765 [Dimorphilus gyrociliatus]|uniref:DgyrCDS10765 n=1 Tax=Dimorphilus gyrociliatus TaxID=2664684 RepID=A0A7I8W1B1_9ANNE|nr:DgyrCDS10765 [Dimorphilus gyrociliatus]